MSPNGLLHQWIRREPGFAFVSPLATVNAAWVMPTAGQRMTIEVRVDNGAAPAGSALSLEQATDNAGAGAKALDFTEVNQKVGAAEYARVGVVGNSHTMDATANETVIVQLEIDPACLDTANGFGFVRVAATDATDAGGDIQYIHWPLRRSD